MLTDEQLLLRAQRGSAGAAFVLGYRKTFGRATRKADWIGAARLWRQAAKAGDSRAQFYLGTCYDVGRGVPKNERTATHWFRKAAVGGDSTAQYNLAISYRKGQGVAKSEKRYLEWLEKASASKEPAAWLDVGYNYHEGVRGYPKDPKKAAHFYRRAARQGKTKAQFNLALCYLHGDGVPHDLELARKWLRAAAGAEHRRARKMLENFEARAIDAAVAREDWKGARKLIATGLKDHPDSHELLTRLSSTYYEEKDYARALVYSEQASRIDPRCPRIQWDLAGALAMLQRHEEAIAIYRRLIKRGADSLAVGVCGEGKRGARALVADCWYRLARCNNIQGQWTRACGYYQRHLAARGPGVPSIYDLAAVKKELSECLARASSR